MPDKSATTTAAQRPTITLDSLKKHAKKPPRICVFGEGGLGKTTLAANAPNPIFILTEDGLSL